MAMMTRNHDEQECHRANNQRRQVIERLREMVECLQECDRYGVSSENAAYPPEWAVPLITYPLTQERRASFDKSQMLQKNPPWENDRKKVQVIGGHVVQECICPKRNGLQADCKMTGCQGNPLCLTKPDPLCPNGGKADMLVTPEQAQKILDQIPGPDVGAPNECITGQACRPECLPCSGSLSDICKYIPEWLELPGQSGPRRGSTFDPDRGDITGVSGPAKAAYKTALEAGRPGSNWWCCVQHSGH